jgi:hypothetical protein
MANTAGQNLSLKESVKISWKLDTVPGLIYNEYMGKRKNKYNKKEIWSDMFNPFIWSDILWIGGTTLATYLFCLYFGYI